MLSFLLTPLMRLVCLRFGFLDQPCRRKIHIKAIPRLGGLAVAAAFLVTLAFVFVVDADFHNALSSKINGLLISVGIIMLAGLWDDIWEIKPFLKLFFHSLAAVVLFYSGFKIKVFTNFLTGAEIQLPFGLSLFLTVLWVIGMINAINLIDGMDGLAAGTALISGLGLLCVSLYSNTMVTVILLSILCGSVSGFLYYNFPPAKIFLGDTGSMFLGLIFAVAGIATMQQKVVTAVTLIIPLCALAIPVSDTFLAIWRRLLKHGSVFIADKKHLHHRFLQLGLSQRQVVVIFYLANVYFGILAFLFVLIPKEYALLLLILLGIGLSFGIRTLGFIERRIRRMFISRRRHALGEIKNQKI